MRYDSSLIERCSQSIPGGSGEWNEGEIALLLMTPGHHVDTIRSAARHLLESAGSTRARIQTLADEAFGPFEELADAELIDKIERGIQDLRRRSVELEDEVEDLRDEMAALQADAEEQGSSE